MSAITTFFDALGHGDTVGGALVHTAGSAAGAAAGSLADTGLDGISSWVLDGTRSALRSVAGLIGATTSPDLTGTWFSSAYWRVAGLATLLTVPFVFAAALQALLRSDPALLSKAVFGYLPLSLLGVSLAAPVTTLLLSATDQMCRIVSASALTGGAKFLDGAAVIAGGLAGAEGSPFFAVIVGLLTVAAALTLALELLIREAAVYVVVMMLPLAFAAFVWPARRVWALRLVELLISLILAKFVIVAVLSLAGSAYTLSGPGISKLLTAMALLLLSTFAPWALLRILPFTELAAGAAGALHHELPQAGMRALNNAGHLRGAVDMAAALPARLRHDADQAAQGHADPAAPAREPEPGSATGAGPAAGPADPTGPAPAHQPPPPSGPAATVPASEPAGSLPAPGPSGTVTTPDPAESPPVPGPAGSLPAPGPSGTVTTPDPAESPPVPGPAGSLPAPGPAPAHQPPPAPGSEAAPAVPASVPGPAASVPAPEPAVPGTEGRPPILPEVDPGKYVEIAAPGLWSDEP